MIKRIERADGPRFQVYAKRDGRKVYVGTYESKRLASAAEEDFKVTQRKIDRGELPAAVDLTRTLDDAASTWLQNLERGGARSHRPYSEFMKAQILPRLGKSQVARMTKEHVARWRDDLIADYAPTTINAALGCLSSAFNAFVESGWVASNPCRGVAPLEVPERTYEWIRTVPEIERLLRSCPDETRDIVAVALGTGMRIDEILHLRWDDVDLTGRLLTVQRGRQGPTKGGRWRPVPILDSVLPVLQARALRRGGALLVFPGRTGRVRSKTSVTVPFKLAVKRAGLPSTLRFHDLRHTMASHWVLRSGDIFRLSKLLGHSSVKITEKTYAHLRPDAWAQDYGRLTFRVPTEPAKLYEFVRDDRGRLAGRRSIGGDNGETAENDARKSA